MSLPGSKMYIVTTLDLIQAVQKCPKALAFPPIEAKFATKICGASKEAFEIAMRNVNGDEGEWGLSTEFYASMRSTLSPGSGLDEMNQVMIKSATRSLESLRPGIGNATRIELVKWLRNSVTLATTDAVYGASNPFKDESLIGAFW